MQGEWIRKPTSETTVVFVHGILSSGETCWQHENGTYWPDLLKDEQEFQALGIYVYTYQTAITSGTYSLNDVVDDLKEHLFNLDEVAKSRRLVFVCHSMGGIVVRKFLVERVYDLVERGIEIGLVLVASPSLGADYANWLEPIAKLAGHSQAKALRFSRDNQWLNGLDKEFKNLKESGSLKIHGKELIEHKFIIPRLWFFPKVVEPFSGACYFGESYKVPDSDHFSIAKPNDKEAVQHRILLKFLENQCQNKKPDATTAAPVREQATDHTNLHLKGGSYDLLTPPLDLWTPGPKEVELITHYEPIVGSNTAQQLWTLSRASISAVANGDFERQIALGNDLENISGSNIYLQGEAAYFGAEGLRLRADIEADTKRKAEFRRQAMDRYRRANELLPCDPRPVRGIGRTLEVLGDYDQALRMFEKSKGLCVMSLSLTEPVKRPDLAHELLRTERHLIHCLLDIRKTNPSSAWRSESKERQIEGYLVECENNHYEFMPVFRTEEPWWLIEWFMGFVFIAKGWGELGNLNRMRQTLIHALDARRRLLRGNGPLSEIEAANLKWWIAAAQERRTAFDNRSYELIEQLAEAVGRRDRDAVHRLVDGFLHPAIPPWGSKLGA